MPDVPNLYSHPVHLGLGASAIPQPAFTGMEWYADYGARHADDGEEGRLVALHRFTNSWDSWEMHPCGAEVVVCTDGTMTLIQELPDGEQQSFTLCAGEYAINPAGVWHTADIDESATGLFITAGKDTQVRPR